MPLTTTFKVKCYANNILVDFKHKTVTALGNNTVTVSTDQNLSFRQ